MEERKPAAGVSVFSPFAEAVMDRFSEGVVVFDAGGKVVYANEAAREAAGDLLDHGSQHADRLLPELARLGSRLAPLRVGKLNVGEAAYIPGSEGPKTLAEREKRAIVETLNATGWKLAETAHRLGISRTTLWRRLRAYGLERDNGKGRSDRDSSEGSA